MRARPYTGTPPTGSSVRNRLPALDVQTVENCRCWFRELEYTKRQAAIVLQRDDVRPEISRPAVEGFRHELSYGIERVVPAVYKAFGDAGSTFLDRLVEMDDAVGELLQAIDGGCRDLLGSDAAGKWLSAIDDASPLFRDLSRAFTHAIVATDGATLDDSARWTHVEFAKHFGIKRENARQRLNRWRQSHRSEAGKSFFVDSDRKSRTPSYLYLVGAVKSLFQ